MLRLRHNRLLQHLIELGARYRLMDEVLAAAEFAEIPRVHVFEFRRHRELPQRQIFFEISVKRLFGATKRAQITSHDFGW